MTVSELIGALDQLKEHYGEEAIKTMRVELHKPVVYDGEEHIVPCDVEFFGTAIYPEEPENPKETVLVIK